MLGIQSPGLWTSGPSIPIYLKYGSIVEGQSPACSVDLKATEEDLDSVQVELDEFPRAESNKENENRTQRWKMHFRQKFSEKRTRLVSQLKSIAPSRSTEDQVKIGEKPEEEALELTKKPKYSDDMKVNPRRSSLHDNPKEHSKAARHPAAKHAQGGSSPGVRHFVFDTRTDTLKSNRMRHVDWSPQLELETGSQRSSSPPPPKSILKSRTNKNIKLEKQGLLLSEKEELEVFLKRIENQEWRRQRMSVHFNELRAKQVGDYMNKHRAS